MGTNEGLEIESRGEMKSGFSAQYAERADSSGNGWKGNFRLTTKGTGSGLREKKDGYFSFQLEGVQSDMGSTSLLMLFKAQSQVSVLLTWKAACMADHGDREAAG